MQSTDETVRQQIVQHVYGPLEIQAGHGTGKTTLLLERYAHLVKNRQAWPYEVLLLTFTRRVVLEMRERLQNLLGEDCDDLPIYTLHGFARSLLARQPEYKQHPYALYDPNQAFRVLRRAMAQVQLPETVWPATFVAGLIAEAKEQAIGPESFATVPGSAGQQALAQTYTHYQALLTKARAMDFADLVLGAVRMLRSDSALLAQLHQHYRFVMVDEFQDTSLGQYALVRQIAGPTANLVIAGSAAQSIYEWRHAHYPRLSAQFQADFPQARQVRLQDNFRSSTQIVAAAGALFHPGQYPDVQLTAQRGAGQPVRDVRVPNEYDEAAFVARETVQLSQTGFALNEMAVFYRTNRQSALVEYEFMRRKVPYVLPQRQRLYHRREVRDMLAYLMLATTDDEQALGQVINTPPRGLGPVTMRLLSDELGHITWARLIEAITNTAELGLKPQAAQTIERFWDLAHALRDAAAQLGPADLIDRILEETGYRAWLTEELDGPTRLNSIHELRHEAEGHVSTAQFLAAVQAQIAADLEQPDDAGVTFLTIHAAKGLQFRVVFVVGLEEGLLPAAKSVDSAAEAGERRLAHVAISRACDLLYLVSAQSRELNGRRIYPRPSRYLGAIPKEVISRYPLNDAAPPVKSTAT
ncbi:MAG: UvrD-helicase domain-containing protein [Anaerolineales bacterium]|nr:UvrD-helicase domain-containing protein [Anaerolineales bacterium]